MIRTFAFAVSCAVLPAQSLVKDINSTGQHPSSSPSSFVTTGTVTYFAAATPAAGIELWKTDGSALGTQLVKDVRPGLLSSNPANLTLVGSTLFFVADDGVTGAELWKSDGTAAGTVLVRDLFTGGPFESSFPASLTAHAGTLYFSAYDGDPATGTGRELWKSDGTLAGTQLVKDLRSGSESGSPGSFCALGSTLLFAANDGTNGTELWKTDGTTAGTVLVKDIAAGSGASTPQGLLAFGSVAIFAADDGTNGVELWKSDGTGAGTTIVRNISVLGSSFPNQFVVLGSAVLFAANDGTTGVELWKTDGTLAGTVRVADIASGATSSAPVGLVAAGSRIFFTAFDATNGRELWKSDGTPGGTVLVADLRAGSSVITQIVAMGTGVAFTFVDDVTGQELWKSDGTAPGTLLVRDANGTPGGGSNPAGLIRVGSYLLYSANDGVLGQELWRSDLTSGGTFMVLDIANLQASSSNPQSFVVVGSQAFFVANDGFTNYELWVTDGTAAGTHLVKDVNPEFGLTTMPRELTSFAGKLWFTADDGIHGRELWSSDGTAAGTTMVKDLWPGQDGSVPMALTVHAGQLFFSADVGGLGSGSGRELWRSDGTAVGTVLVKDFLPGAGSGLPASSGALHVLGSNLIVFATDGTTGTEVWVSDGTAAGTSLVRDVNPGAGSGVVIVSGGTAIASGALFFNGFDPAHGQELWKTDGTASGTTLVFDILPGPVSSLPYPMVAYSGAVFLQADDGLHGYELWSSNGTGSGTTIVSDTWPGSQSGFPASFTVADDRLFFFATDLANPTPSGRELWVSDGTMTGTGLVRDVAAGSSGSVSGGFARPLALGAGRKVLFAADDRSHGFEVWLSNGSQAGTRLVTDLALGAADGAAPSLEGIVLGNRFLYAGDNGATGIELFAYDLPTLGAAVVETIGTGCPGTGGLTPKLSTIGVPNVGNGGFGLSLKDALPGAPSVLLLNNQRLDIPLGGGCTLHVALPAVVVSMSVGAAGTAAVSLPIPPGSANVGVELYFQAAVLDPNGSWTTTASFTPGLRTLLGDF